MTVKTGIKSIGLESSSHRRKLFIEQASEAKSDWSFYPAHLGVGVPLTYNSKAAVRRFGRALSASEVGCYTSHFKCWEWLANSDFDQIIVFEDDVLIDWAAIDKLASFNLSDHGIDLLRLYSTHPLNCNIIRPRFLSPHHHLVRSKGETFGTQGYIMSKNCAKKLISLYTSIEMPVDWVISRYWEHGFVNFALVPFPIVERYLPSTISACQQGNITVSFSDKIFRKYWIWRDKVTRLAYHVLRTPQLPLESSNDSGPSYL